MSIVIDLILLALIALSVILSVKRGFVKTAIELAGFVLAIVLTFAFSEPLANATYDNFIKTPVENVVRDSITDAVGDIAIDIDTSKFEEVWDSLPAFLKDNSEQFGISKDDLKGDFMELDTTQVENTAIGIADSVARPVITTILNAVFALLIFFVVTLLAKLLSGPLNKLFSFSIVGKINKILGGVLGGIKGIIWACVFCGVISLIFFVSPSGFLFFTPENLEATYIYKLLSGLVPFI